jgi:adenine deaminase
MRINNKMFAMKTKEIIERAMAKIKADYILRGGKYVNVFTRELLEGDLVISGNKIVHIGLETEEFEGDSTEIIDVKGKVICPGLIESHIHIESSKLTLSEFTKAVVTRGTTAVVIDPHELANVTGIEGLNVLFEEVKKQKIRYFVEAPSCVPSLPGFETSGSEITAADIEELMQREEVFALAEMMNYPGVFLGFEEVVRKIDAAKKSKKLVEGHAPLLTGKELQTYIASGIVSDHETSSFEEALEKLRLGMKLQIREGSFAKDLVNIMTELNKCKIDTRNILIASDDRNPVDLYEKGHLDYTYRILIKAGIDPLEAVQMLTINPATHLNVDYEIGSLSPGKNADVIVVDNLNDFNIDLVFAGGEIVAQQGKITYTQEKIDYPNFILDTVSNLHLPEIDDLSVFSKDLEQVKVKVISLNENSLITDYHKHTLKVENGRVLPDLDNDILPIVVINRHTEDRRIGKGFVKGLGIKEGAIASTIAHDSHQLICVGTDYLSMHKAISKIKEVKGGQVVVFKDKVTVLPLEFAGIMSSLPLEEVVEKTQQLDESLLDLDTTISEPFMALAFVSLPVIPHLKITDYGLVDVDTMTKVSVFEE